MVKNGLKPLRMIQDWHQSNALFSTVKYIQLYSSTFNSIQIFKAASVQIFKYSKIQIFKYSKILKYAETYIPNYSNIQIFKYSNIKKNTIFSNQYSL